MGRNFLRGFFPLDFHYFRFNKMQEIDLSFQEIIDIEVLNVEPNPRNKNLKVFGIFMKRVCSKQINQSNKVLFAIALRKTLILPSGHKVFSRVGWRILDVSKKQLILPSLITVKFFSIYEFNNHKL